MSNPWDNDPVVGKSGDAEPWKADAEVSSSPKTFGDHLISAASNFWDQVNPVKNAQGVVDTAMNLGSAVKAYGARNAELFQKAEDAYKKGNYTEAVSHGLNYLLNGIPGVGSTLDEAGEQAKSGDVGGALGKTAGLATLLLGTPKVPAAAGAVADAAPKVAQAVKDVATSPRVLKGAGAAVGGIAGHMIPIPGAGVVGALAGREAGGMLSDSLEAGKAAAKAAPKAAAEIPEEVSAETAHLDDIAKAMIGKSFEKATPFQQETIRKIAAKDVAPASAGPQASTAPPDAGPMPAAEPLPASPVDTSAVPIQHPPFAPNAPFSPSRVARQMTPAPTRPPTIDDLLLDLRSKMEEHGMVPRGGHLGDEAGDIKIPSDSPLAKNPKALDLALQLAEEMKK